MSLIFGVRAKLKHLILSPGLLELVEFTQSCPRAQAYFQIKPEIFGLEPALSFLEESLPSIEHFAYLVKSDFKPGLRVFPPLLSAWVRGIGPWPDRAS